MGGMRRSGSRSSFLWGFGSNEAVRVPSEPEAILPSEFLGSIAIGREGRVQPRCRHRSRGTRTTSLHSSDLLERAAAQCAMLHTETRARLRRTGSGMPSRNVTDESGRSWACRLDDLTQGK